MLVRVVLNDLTELRKQRNQRFNTRLQTLLQTIDVYLGFFSFIPFRNAVGNYWIISGFAEYISGGHNDSPTFIFELVNEQRNKPLGQGG